MKYLLAFSLILFFGSFDAQACVSKNDCDCWCKQHPGQCPECGKPLGQQLVAAGLNPTGKSFIATGTNCANPYDHEGPDYLAAHRAVDTNASKQCFPYQALQMTDYREGAFNKCPSGFWGSQAAAGFTCAK